MKKKLRMLSITMIGILALTGCQYSRQQETKTSPEENRLVELVVWGSQEDHFSGSGRIQL